MFPPGCSHWKSLNSSDLAFFLYITKIADKFFVSPNYTLHYKLNDLDNKNIFLHSWGVKKLLSRGPKFGLIQPSVLWKQSLSLDLNVFEYRFASVLDRANRANIIAFAKDKSREMGILDWKPLRVPYPNAEYKTLCKNIYKKDNELYHNCPELQSEMFNLKNAVLHAGCEIANVFSKFKQWKNISKAEKLALNRLQKMDICYGLADKNLGPVISSKDLVVNQLKLHLFDTAGTYREITNILKKKLISNAIQKLSFSNMAFSADYEGLLNTFTHHASWCEEKLCRAFILWKLHKKPKDNGLESRLIAPNVNYFTSNASTFLHFQLAPFVFNHKYVLQDSLSLCRIIEQINQQRLNWSNIHIATADVVALYPSIDIKSGQEALKWFLDKLTNFSDSLKKFILHIADWVLDNNYVEVEGVGSGIFKQVVGVPMGTSFSVVFSIIFMLKLEHDIIEKYQNWILLYKRAIDDLLFIWQGPTAEFSNMKADFDKAHPNIQFDWSSLCKSAVFLDLNLSLKLSVDSALFIESSVYCKPSNAFCYLQPDSYHPSHNFKGWIRGLLIRNLTRSNTVDNWRDENLKLYYRLRARGHSHGYLLALFQKVIWSERSKFLSSRSNSDEPTSMVVLSTPFSPGFDALRRTVPLSFQSFRNTSFTMGIFPPNGTWVARKPPTLGSILRPTKK